MYPTWLRALHGLKGGVGRSSGIGGRLRVSGRSGQAGPRYFFAWVAREAAARGRTPLRLGQMAMKFPTRARGCRFGWTTLMRSIDNALPLDWMSLSRRPICLGGSARCTFGIRMGMCFESAKALWMWITIEGLSAAADTGVRWAGPRITCICEDGYMIGFHQWARS